VKIVAVTKTFPLDKIKPLINYGHLHYGENKIQEAVNKWTEIKKNNKNLKLHFIGKLQTNKVKFALPLFDYIHSLDNLKLAEKISSFQSKVNFKPNIFVQVNIGEEKQKNGISINELNYFINECKNNLDLNIIGLMCIPPNDGNANEYFIKMKKINVEQNLAELSIGMSSDYLIAVNNGATFIRIGSKIFGERN
tara:strand:- start:4898 stop:5479 length:582 start_codon:yes stop_codon:yes gene_type:complete